MAQKIKQPAVVFSKLKAYEGNESKIFQTDPAHKGFNCIQIFQVI